MITDPFEDIRVKLIIPHAHNKALVVKIKKNMKEFKKTENIHLWITRMYKYDSSVYIEMEGARQIKLPRLIERILPKRPPKRFNVLAKMNKTEELAVFLKRKKASIRKFCGNCDIHMVGYNLEKGDDKVLVILLVEMTS